MAKDFFQPQNDMCRKTVESIQLYSLVLGPVFASEHFWFYAKHTSNTLKFMLLHFKELVVSLKTHPLGSGRSPTQEEKKTNKKPRAQEKNCTRGTQESSVSTTSVHRAQLPIQFLLGLPCMKVSHQRWNTLFSFSSNDYLEQSTPFIQEHAFIFLHHLL